MQNGKAFFQDTKMEPRRTLFKPPKHIKYELLKARLDSFVGWPSKYVPKTPEQLAAAGFFYIGSADRVTCFQCGITLRDWEANHDPVAEHRKYSEHCQFINQTDVDHLGVEVRVLEPQDVKSPGSGTVVPSERSTDDRNIAVSNQQAEPLSSKAIGTNGHHDYTKGRVSLLDLRHSSHGHCGTCSSEDAVNGCNTAKEALSNNSLTPSSEATKTNGHAKEARSKIQYNNHNATITNPVYQENKKLRWQMTCRLCETTGVNTVFLPCGHLVTCSNCAPRVTSCVVCSKSIAGTLKTFMV